MSLEPVYDSRADPRKVEAATHIAPVPAVFGSAKWWSALGTSALPLHRIEGQVASVYWGSMGDWPEF